MLSFAAVAATTSTRLSINAVGRGSLASAPTAQSSGANEPNEIDPGSVGDDAGAADPVQRPGSSATRASSIQSQAATVVRHRSIRKSEGDGEKDDGRRVENNGAGVVLGFDGLTLRNQRLANGGNQFTVEPPDQGLCVGNGFVLESVNDVLRIWDANGNPLTGVIDLNTFYGYPAAINRSNGDFGPSITDPSCVYDAATSRWFHVVLTLDRKGTTSALSGKNHLDIAVSDGADPRGSWTIYKLPVQNDGTDGTPNHFCTGGPCLGDYPHIAVNRDGIYLTTNEFAVFGPGFFGAQVYAISKRALINRSATVPVVLINTGDPSIPFNGFTLWPAQAPAGGDDASDDDGDGNGTEHFMSSLAVFEASGTSNQILVWSLSNTRSLNGATPNLSLGAKFVDTLTYGVPPRSDQKAGNFPFGQCLGDTTTGTPFGVGCWRNFFVAGGPFPNVEKKIDSNDSRMQQVYYSQGKLWGALDTAVTVGGEKRAGIAWFVVNPKSGKVKNQGVIAVAGNNVTRPALAATAEGRGIVAFTLTGKDHYPSAAYATLSANYGAGSVHVVAEGVGPDDGFTGYNPTGNFGTRSRWGDYGAAATDGRNIWIASEYIGQSCTLDQYVSSGFACGGTRVSQGNWYTRVTKLITFD
ncbi:MAG TPA: hypothetical protein VGO77_17625 [Mycobacterium sp.]|nr:hypothetical protein [Mycobacterium sp.]